VGDDDLFHGDRYKGSLRFTVINLTNKTALYNFLSTFSGTHYVSPRAETVELGFHFWGGDEGQDLARGLRWDPSAREARTSR